MCFASSTKPTIYGCTLSTALHSIASCTLYSVHSTGKIGKSAELILCVGHPRTFLSSLLPMRFLPIEKFLRDDVDKDETIALMMTFIHDNL